MFRKLFSYDMRAVKPIFKLQALISLILSVFCGLAQRRLNYGRMDDTYQGLLITFVSLCFVWFFASYFIVQVNYFNYCKKNFYSDEGYLTFTLPVTRRQLLCSKTLGCVTLGAMQMLLYLTVGAIMLLLAPVPDKGSVLSLEGYRILFRGLADWWNSVGAWMLVYLLEIALLLGCLQLLFGAIVFYCEALAAARKKKTKGVTAVFIGILIYYVINSFLGLSIFSLSLGYSNPLSLLTLLVGIFERLNAQAVNAGWALVLGAACTAAASFGWILVCLTLDRLERKLNLT